MVYYYILLALEAKLALRTELGPARASTHLLLHSRNNSSRNEDAYAKGNTLENNKNSQASSHIP